MSNKIPVQFLKLLCEIFLSLSNNIIYVITIYCSRWCQIWSFLVDISEYIVLRMKYCVDLFLIGTSVILHGSSNTLVLTDGTNFGIPFLIFFLYFTLFSFLTYIFMKFIYSSNFVVWLIIENQWELLEIRNIFDFYVIWIIK